MTYDVGNPKSWLATDTNILRVKQVTGIHVWNLYFTHDQLHSCFLQRHRLLSTKLLRNFFKYFVTRINMTRHGIANYVLVQS